MYLFKRRQPTTRNVPPAIIEANMQFLELGINIDALYSLRQARLELQRKIEDLKAQEVELRQGILAVLDTAGLAKASGSLATCGVRRTLEPMVQDWGQVHEYIRENGAFELLQRRMSAPAWREFHEAGVVVPGTEAFEAVDVSLTKSTR